MSEFILGSICLTTLIEKAKQGHSAFSKSPKAIRQQVWIKFIGKKFENKPVTASDLPQDNWQANVPVRETKPTTTTGSDISPKPTEDLPF